MANEGPDPNVAPGLVYLPYIPMYHPPPGLLDFTVRDRGYEVKTVNHSFFATADIQGRGEQTEFHFREELAFIARSILKEQMGAHWNANDDRKWAAYQILQALHESKRPNRSVAVLYLHRNRSERHDMLIGTALELFQRMGRDQRLSAKARKAMQKRFSRLLEWAGPSINLVDLLAELD